MAVQDFIPLMDAKQTVEKEVKQKPKLTELTKIESPGRPVSVDSLIDNNGEEKAVKRKARKKTERVEPSKIERIGNYILIITEKPQAAQKIAFALGKTKKHLDSGVSYFEVEREGRKIVVASAVGHLFNLTNAPGQKGWPIFELEWRPSYEKEDTGYTKKYYDLLNKLSKRAGDIIIATDYDVEGEVIGWNVLRFICKREDAKRMKFSTLTKNELEKAFLNPLIEIDWRQAYAGEARHIMDWLYGINLSRALMSAIKTTGSFKILSIGRVQGPALKVIVEREREIENFKPEPYWQVFAVIDGFDFKHSKDIFEKELLEKFKDIKSGIAETKEEDEKIIPPHPFDLTTLQREIYRVYGISPSQALQVAQSLYLAGLISYPRTSSQKIPVSINAKKILKELEKNYPEAKEVVREKPVEGEKSDPAHPSIYPTGEFKRLKENEKKIYELIVKRFIGVFSDDALVKNKNVKIIADKKEKGEEIKFTANGLKIIKKGWTKVYPATLEEKDVPTLNGPVKIDEIKNEEKETQPPKRYTPTSLITLLEKKNLGTKTTRSMIVDTLFERGYLEGRSIKATPLGMKLIESLEKHSPIIIDENLTKEFEEEMNEIEESAGEKEENIRETLDKKEKEILNRAKRVITDISKEFRAKEIEIGKDILKGIEGLREEQVQNNTLRECPNCKKGNLRIMYSRKINRYFVACSNYPECKHTYSLPPNALIKKAEKNCESCLWPKLLSIKKAKRPWEFCFNPDCEINKKRLEEWRARKEFEKKTNNESTKGVLE
ncbi:DNA topoisomerase I [Candidatus Pacearchaeota archaeon]|nr:DNA topoisomerase I [Candidatus Pacearchaeota archaeon]